MHDTYSILREFADSWALLGLFAVFGFVVFWAYRPGSRAVHDDAALSIFPERRAPDMPRLGCGKGCAGCVCGKAEDEA